MFKKDRAGLGIPSRLTQTGIAAIGMLLVMLLMHSCQKETYDLDKIGGVSWGPEFAIPLVDTRLTLADILKEGSTGDILLVDSLTNLLTVVYKSDVFSQTADDLFQLPDQGYDTTMTVNPPIAIPAGDSVKVSLPISITFNTNNGESLDSIKYTGTSALKIDITGDMDHDARFILSFPGLTKNGQPLLAELNYDYTSSLPIVIDESISLDGYTVVFNSAANGLHTLLANIELTAYGDANPNTGPYTFDITIDQVDLEFITLYGYLGQQVISLPSDTVAVDVFNSAISGTFAVEDPRVTINIHNSFGTPMSFDVKTLRGLGVNPPYDVTLSGPGLPNPLFINSPTVQQVGQEITTSIFLNKGNTNIDDLLNIAPNKLFYEMDGLMNPSGNTVINFVQPQSGVRVDVEFEMPLAGKISGFILEDTIDFSLDVVEQLESILFRLNVSNGFPIDARAQVYMVDSNYTRLDSLLQPMQLVIASGVPGPAPDYKVQSPTTKVTDIELSGSRLAAVADTRYLIIRATLNTADNGTTNVRFYSDYGMDVKMGVRTKLKITD